MLPNIDEWRPYIAQQLSSALKTNITLGKVTADWKGLHPRLAFIDVSITDKRQRKVMNLPQVRAVLSWRSLFSQSPQFVSLEASDIDISVRRDRRQRLWVAGQSFDVDSLEQQQTGQHDEVLAWLATQRQIVVRDATIHWIDEKRSTTPLILNAVTVSLQNSGMSHAFSLVAALSPELGQTLDVRGNFQQASASVSQPFSIENGNGLIYAHVAQMRPLGWSRWVDLPQQLESGEVSAKWWLTIGNGQAGQLTSDVRVEQGRWELGEEAYVQAEYLRLFMAGPWDAFKDIFMPETEPAFPQQAKEGTSTSTPTVEFHLQARKLDLVDSDMFEHPIDFSRIGGQGTIRKLPGATLRVEASQLNLDNDDMKATLAGSWQQGAPGSTGLVDIRGRFKRALITAIDDYMPNLVNLDAREWMATGLLDGQLEDVDVTLNGDLEHFPFAQDPSKGNFRVSGRFTGGVIDYLPDEGKVKGWPRLTEMQGRVELQRADLRLVAERAVMWPTSGLPIQLKDVTAHIPNIEDNSVLSVEGLTAAQGEAYLALMKHSPLGGMLDGTFNEATADGHWEVPLALTIPLLNSRDTTVKGAIRFSDSSLRLSPEMPLLTNVAGVLDFTDTGMSTAGLKAVFLGGPVSLAGGIGAGLKGLQLEGRASAQALTEYVGLEGMKRLQGVVPYKMVLQRSKARTLSVTLDSNLIGLGLKFPAPLGKSANEAMPMHAEWQRHSDGKNMALTLALGKEMNATLLHSENRRDRAYFHAVAVGVNQKPELLAEGINLDIRYPNIDVDSWEQVITEFSTSLTKATARRERPLLPDIRQLRLQSREARVYGLRLDQLTFTARQPRIEQWRVDVSSSQTAGTLFWREAKGKVAGRIDANFDRLALGRDRVHGTSSDDAKENSLRIDDDLDIPAVNLRVKNFRLYGREVGELSVVGINQARGELWKLEELKLVSPSASLAGAGMWRLEGKNRGLTLDAVAQIGDLGAYLDQIGMRDMMKGGKGSVRGQFEWHNMPWDFSKSDLNGKVEFDLEKGRFSNLNSRSSRLLELISLQSMQRLARLDFNPAGLTKEGFPYDKFRGTLNLNSGVMSTSDYRVVGPVATIVMGGDVNLINEKLDLQAVVVPNLDVSGAAIAAGIAINPIVGVGAFLTQWLLQGPLARAMTVEYRINGNWDDPNIKEVAAPPASSGDSGRGTTTGKPPPIAP
ncbi:TIGR02099 family protein [Candidimonas sp. SYP-B2681]|uniref:YhdP family protein n=1 Tax=Candidimonas sp. SYP-B2681 TaxID=2497686 RepID=UPI000F88ADCD|nr:YhdP family protein [Candidimonas sp. SYP-B2681]RTZ41040.1 TIGR02099 family protein [Candidimonas sp. SYP-B2681]